MAYQSFLEYAVSQFNGKIPTMPEFQEFLKHYDGRSVTINVKKDAFYTFNISKEGLKLKIAESEKTKDMYIETDKKTMQSIMNERRISMKDLMLGKIKWKNISLTDVSQVKKILGIHSLDFKDKGTIKNDFEKNTA